MNATQQSSKPSCPMLPCIQPKVQLVCNIFNEKTVAAQEERNLIGTTIFVKMVTKMWNIINIKSPHAGFRTNDPDNNPFRDKSDDHLQYLTKLATTYERMDNSPRDQRMHSLTSDTSNALHRTLTGIVVLIKLKLDIGSSLVLPGKVQSDRKEGEFSIYRKNRGENYCISMYQVFNSLKLAARPVKNGF